MLEKRPAHVVNDRRHLAPRPLSIGPRPPSDGPKAPLVGSARPSLAFDLCHVKGPLCSLALAKHQATRVPPRMWWEYWC